MNDYSNLIAGIVLPAFFLILIGVLITVFSITMKHKRKQQEFEIAKELNKRYQQPTQQPETKIQHIVKPKHDEVIDTLNFMLEHQIIDTTEYNQLLVKSLPFLE